MLKLLFVVSCCRLAAAESWRPVDPPELAQKTARAEPGADAEAIFWDVKIEDTLAGGDFHLTMSHYIRIKIFTALGKEKYATVEIEQPRRRNITDVTGCTIKPDGSVVELKKDGIFERE